MSYETSKLKCEQLMTAFSVRKRMTMVTLRFANVVGGNDYHGVTRDYFERLLVDPTNLRVLGDGNQRRSYVHLNDCVSAIGSAARNAREGQEVYNVRFRGRHRFARCDRGSHRRDGHRATSDRLQVP